MPALISVIIINFYLIIMNDFLPLVAFRRLRNFCSSAKKKETKCYDHKMINLPEFDESASDKNATNYCNTYI